MCSRLQRLLNPRSIAFVGGSQMAGAIRSCRRGGFEGDIHVVNPRAAKIEGVRCMSSIDALPAPPDAALIGVGADLSIETVRALAEAGAGGAVVIAAGFREQGGVGDDRQAALVDAAGDMPVLGPNCMGLINQFSGAAVWGDETHIAKVQGPACAIISQSGAMLIGMTGVEQALPLGLAISTGNQAVTGMSALIEAVLEKPDIRAIGLYLEGMDDGRTLGDACLEAARRGVPVVALKGGDNAAGEAVALSHTAAMVVERDLWEAFCRRFGLVEVSSPKALVETLKLLTIAGIPAGNRVSVISYSGGVNGLIASRAGGLGLSLPMPTDDNRQAMREVLPATVALANPLDLNIPFTTKHGISLEDREAVAGVLVQYCEGVSDQAVFIIDVPREGPENLDKVWSHSVEGMIDVRQRLGIPCTVAGILPEGLPVTFRNQLQANGVAALLGLSETLEALSASAQISRIHTSLVGVKPQPLLSDLTPVFASEMLDEAESKTELASVGLVVPGCAVAQIADAESASENLSFPVAVKVLSSAIAHKLAVGGVHLWLETPAAVQEAAEAIACDVKSATGETVDRVLIEEMIPDALAEYIIGVKRHPGLGLALMVGFGGSAVEQMHRYETILLPLEVDAVESAFERLGAVKTPGLIATAMAVAEYATTNADTLVTVDVNPVIVTRDGRAMAADALIVRTKH
ncbi:MAG: acetate--CoA ligase family protein [Pseudomonadota bacterium]